MPVKVHALDHLVINVSDVQKVKLVLERAMADHRRFYKVYKDLVQVIGIH